ncbi:MAG: Bug family tripartite tricarboxylate transporter substrate binding protein [Burkholderiales bacterium]
MNCFATALLATTRRSARIRVAISIGVALASIGFTPAVGAQQYPSKPIRLIVASSAGGGIDLLARIIAPRFAELVGQPVLVDNRPGAGGTMGYEYGVRSAPDGYTLTIISSTYTVNPSFYPLKFDAVADCTPISHLVKFPHVVVVHPSLPAKTIRELIVLAKASPGGITFGSSGQGAIIHLSTELFMEMAGIRMTHVPYRGGGPALNDVIAGQISLVFAPPQTGLPQVKARRVRALAVTTRERLPAEPDIPSVAESGVPGFDLSSWHALIGPKGLPQAVVERVNREIRATLNSREVEERMQAAGVAPSASTPEELHARLQKEIAMWKHVVSRAHIKIE